MAVAMMAAGNLKADDFPRIGDPHFWQKQEQWYEQRRERQQLEERMERIEEQQRRQDCDDGFYIPIIQ